MEQVKKRIGRPPRVAAEDVAGVKETILERIATGESVNHILKTPGMPRYITVLNWLQDDPVFRSKYTHAKEDMADTLADEIMAIADETAPRDSYGKTDPGWIAWQRNRIDTRKWIASKLKPKKYGERQQIDQTVTVTLTPEQVDARLAELMEKAGG